MRSFMRFSILFSVLILTGCTEQLPPMQPATRIIEKPVVIRPPELKMRYQFNYGSNPALKRAYEKYLSSGKAPDITTDGFKQFAYGVGRQPIITASPMELTVISLEPGECVTNVSSGDPTRWSYSLAYSGQSKLKQAHVMVKPAQSNISTDLVITTDKRLYTLKIVAKNCDKYIRDIRFWYPDEMQDFWEHFNAEGAGKVALENQEKIAELPNINVNALNFNYCLSRCWSSPNWKPIRVFDDGTHTYIQFSASISSRDMPALFILNGNNKELVNYRSKPPYFVVDKIFKKAVLVSDKKTIVIINNRF